MRATAGKKAGPVRIGNASSKGRYRGHELSAPATRAGADQSLSLPTRVGDRLHYRCGRVTDLGGAPIAISVGALHE